MKELGMNRGAGSLVDHAQLRPPRMGPGRLEVEACLTDLVERLQAGPLTSQDLDELPFTENIAQAAIRLGKQRGIIRVEQPFFGRHHATRRYSLEVPA